MNKSLLLPFPLVRPVVFNSEAQTTQRTTDDKAIDSAMLGDLRVSVLRTMTIKTRFFSLGVTLALWFISVLSGSALGQDSNSIATVVLAKSGSSWDGTALPAYPTDKPEITILRITIPPGAALPLHKHPVINAGVLLSGELTVFTEDEKKKVLKPGDALVEVVNKWHFGKSTGKEPAVILVFYAGSLDGPITVRK